MQKVVGHKSASQEYACTAKGDIIKLYNGMKAVSGIEQYATTDLLFAFLCTDHLKTFHDQSVLPRDDLSRDL